MEMEMEGACKTVLCARSTGRGVPTFGNPNPNPFLFLFLFLSFSSAARGVFLQHLTVLVSDLDARPLFLL